LPYSSSCYSRSSGDAVAAAAAAAQQQRAACAGPQCGCVRRHLANRNELRVSGLDSYALRFLFYE